MQQVEILQVAVAQLQVKAGGSHAASSAENEMAVMVAGRTVQGAAAAARARRNRAGAEMPQPSGRYRRYQPSPPAEIAEDERSILLPARSLQAEQRERIAREMMREPFEGRSSAASTAPAPGAPAPTNANAPRPETRKIRIIELYCPSRTERRIDEAMR